MADDEVRLEVESERADALFQRVEDVYLPLCVAAAITFHQAHGSTKAIVSRRDYDDALNIAAAALSRLIPILVLRDPREGRVPLTVDLTRAHFARGATELRSGAETVRELWVGRSDLIPALSLVKRAGLVFALAANGF